MNVCVRTHACVCACSCCVCVPYLCMRLCIRVSARLSGCVGTCVSLFSGQVRRSCRMMSSPVTFSASCSCSVKDTTQVCVCVILHRLIQYCWDSLVLFKCINDIQKLLVVNFAAFQLNYNNLTLFCNFFSYKLSQTSVMICYPVIFLLTALNWDVFCTVTLPLDCFSELISQHGVSDFQNYLRTQTGNNTTVNIIISTVDYLLRVQVSSFCVVLLN